jgi:hypothetical protein
MSASESNMHAPAAAALCRSRFRHSSTALATTARFVNIQHLPPQRTIASTLNGNPSTSGPVSQNKMVQGLGRPDTGLLQLLLLRKRMCSHSKA